MQLLIVYCPLFLHPYFSSPGSIKPSHKSCDRQHESTKLFGPNSYNPLETFPEPHQKVSIIKPKMMHKKVIFGDKKIHSLTADKLVEKFYFNLTQKVDQQIDFFC